MEQIECSEMSAYTNQTPGNHPKENKQHSEHGESLKSRIVASCFYNFKCLRVFRSTLSACLPSLTIPDYFLWAISKVRYTEHVLPVGDELKQWIQECIKGISKEMPQCVTTTFILWLQDCTEQHGGHLQSVIFKQWWLTLILIALECIY